MKTPEKKERIETTTVERSMKKSMEDLSNMIFGLALSIGALTLIDNTTSDPHLIVLGLVTFSFSFIILIYIWLRYTKILEIIKVETNFEKFLNLTMLFLVVIEPYLFNLLHTASYSAPADTLFSLTTAIFAIDIGGMMLVLGTLYTIGMRIYQEGEQKHSLNSARYALFIAGIVFIASALPQFWQYSIFGIQARFFAWIILVIFVFTLRHVLIMLRIIS